MNKTGQHDQGNQEAFYYSDRPSWLNQAGSFGSMLILILMPFFIGDMTPVLVAINILAVALIMLTIIYSRHVWQFRISDGDIQSQHGIGSKKQRNIRLKSIRNIRVKQTATQRVFGVGDVEFSTAGNINNKIVFSGIGSPFALRDQVLHAQQKRKT